MKFYFLNLVILTILLILVLLKTNKPKQNELTIPNQEHVSKLMEKINSSNSLVQSIICHEIGSKKANSKLTYQKPDDFLLVIENKIGKQLEIGFNKQFFWFWMRGFDSKNLYYCDRDKVHKTRVKPELYPEVLSDLLGLNFIDSKNFNFFKSEKLIMAIEQKFGLKHVLFIDEEKVIKQSYYQDDVLILQTEVKSFSNYKEAKIPNKIVISFIQEGISIPLEIQPAEINFDKIEIKMPNNLNKINLEDY